MKISPYNEKDHYADLETTWTLYGWPGCPANALPHIGYVAYSESGNFIAYLGMYMEKERAGFIEWALRHPDAEKEAAASALRGLFEALVDEAKTNGCKFVYSMTKTEPWKKKLLSYGMKVAEDGATTFVMPLLGGETDFVSD